MLKERIIRKSKIGLLIFTALLLLDCAPVLEVNIHNFDFKSQRNAHTIVVASIEEVQKYSTLLIGRKVKIKGHVTYSGFKNFSYWHLILKDNKGNYIRCYEETYRVEAWVIPVMAARDARKNKDLLTAVGKLKGKDLLELDWIEYKGQKIDTDILPSSTGRFFF